MPDPSSEASRILGDRIRTERLRLGLSQDDVANLAGMHSSNYGKLERGIGNPVLHTIVKIGAVLGVDPAVFVAGLTAEQLPPSQRAYSAVDFVRERDARN